jgi:acetyltransferase-like isoleucine patch superfamily enzyme
MSFKDVLHTNFIKVAAKKMICFLKRVKSGTNTSISWKAQICNSRKIKLGSSVVIERYARLFAYGNSAEIIIHDNTYIHSYVLIKADNGKIRIGKNCTINDYSILYGHGDLIIGDDVHIAAHTIIIPMNHIYQGPNIPISQQGTSKIGITIEDGVWIGASVVILDGVKVGKGAVIGAGAVVTESIPAYAVAVGVPAKVVKQRR